MPENLNSTIGYSGEVAIKRIDNRTGKTTLITKHNDGKIGLFSFLAHAIQAANADKYKPSKLILCSVEGGTETVLLNNPAAYQSLPVTFNDGNRSDNLCNQVQLIFSVPSGLFNNPTALAKKLYLVNGLYDPADTLQSNLDNGGICAEVTLDDGIQLAAGINLVIYWKLKFE